MVARNVCRAANNNCWTGYLHVWSYRAVGTVERRMGLHCCCTISHARYRSASSCDAPKRYLSKLFCVLIRPTDLYGQGLHCTRVHCDSVFDSVSRQFPLRFRLQRFLQKRFFFSIVVFFWKYFIVIKNVLIFTIFKPIHGIIPVHLFLDSSLSAHTSVIIFQDY